MCVKIIDFKGNNMNNELLAKISRPTWKPVLEEKTGLLDDSKYFGNPWLAESENWPEIGGFPALFVLQLNVSSLPEQVAKHFGGKGLVQFFYQTHPQSTEDYDQNYLVRLVDNTKTSKVIAQPPVEDYPLEGDFPKEKVIVSWKEYVDYPHYEDEIGLKLSKEELKEMRYNDIFATQGDKLGGWPFWTQAREIEKDEIMIFQLDAGCFFNGAQFEAHAPDLFATNGTGHILVSQDDISQLRFVWAC